MHLLIDARLFSPTFGIGRYTFELCQQFFQLRPTWKFTLLLPSSYEIYSFPKNVDIIIANEKIYSVAEQTTFLKKLYNISPDLTWFPHFSVPIGYTRPFVVTVHDLTISKFPGNKKSSLLHRFAYYATLKNALWRSRHIFSVSEHTKKDIIHDEHINPSKITVAYNAVGNEYFNYTPDSCVDLSLLGIKKPFFFYAGNWREHKNIVGLIKAFHLFIKNTNAEVYLVVSGKSDPLYPEFLQYRSKHHLEKNVILPGLVSEKILKELYVNAMAFVFPSLYEGFGLPPLEAMAMGTPVIASSASCIPEVCGDAALYFAPYNIESMEQAMNKIFYDPMIQKNLIDKGKEQAKKYSWEKSAEILLKKMELLV